MGRTLPTSTQLIQEFEDSWQAYARALRREDREMLLELFAMVRFQSAAIAYASRPDPFQAFCLAMLGGIMKRLVHLEFAMERTADYPPGPPPTDGHPSARDWYPELALLLPDRVEKR